MENLEELGNSSKPEEGIPPSEPAEKQVPYKEFEKVFARAKKAEEGEKALREELAVLKKPLEAKPTQDPVDAEMIEWKVDQRLKGRNRDEITKVEAFAKGQSKKPWEVEDDPFVVSGIEGLRAKAKVEQATPPPSTKTDSLKGPAREEKKHSSFDDWKSKKAAK